MDITIDNLTVNENHDGAVIGNVTVEMQNLDTVMVMDPRFEIIGGVLRLVPGESFVVVIGNDGSGLVARRQRDRYHAQDHLQGQHSDNQGAPADRGAAVGN